MLTMIALLMSLAPSGSIRCANCNAASGPIWVIGDLQSPIRLPPHPELDGDAPIIKQPCTVYPGYKYSEPSDINYDFLEEMLSLSRKEEPRAISNLFAVPEDRLHDYGFTSEPTQSPIIKQTEYQETPSVPEQIPVQNGPKAPKTNPPTSSSPNPSTQIDYMYTTQAPKSTNPDPVPLPAAAYKPGVGYQNLDSVMPTPQVQSHSPSFEQLPLVHDSQDIHSLRESVASWPPSSKPPPEACQENQICAACLEHQNRAICSNETLPESNPLESRAVPNDDPTRNNLDVDPIQYVPVPEKAQTVDKNDAKSTSDSLKDRAPTPSYNPKETPSGADPQPSQPAPNGDDYKILKDKGKALLVSSEPDYDSVVEHDDNPAGASGGYFADSDSQDGFGSFSTEPSLKGHSLNDPPAAQRPVGSSTFGTTSSPTAVPDTSGYDQVARNAPSESSQLFRPAPVYITHQPPANIYQSTPIPSPNGAPNEYRSDSSYASGDTSPIQHQPNAGYPGSDVPRNQYEPEYIANNQPVRHYQTNQDYQAGPVPSRVSRHNPPSVTFQPNPPSAAFVINRPSIVVHQNQDYSSTLGPSVTYYPDPDYRSGVGPSRTVHINPVVTTIQPVQEYAAGVGSSVTMQQPNLDYTNGQQSTHYQPSVVYIPTEAPLYRTGTGYSAGSSMAYSSAQLGDFTTNPKSYSSRYRQVVHDPVPRLVSSARFGDVVVDQQLGYTSRPSGEILLDQHPPYGSRHHEPQSAIRSDGFVNNKQAPQSSDARYRRVSVIPATEQRVTFGSARYETTRDPISEHASRAPNYGSVRYERTYEPTNTYSQSGPLSQTGERFREGTSRPAEPTDWLSQAIVKGKDKVPLNRLVNSVRVKTESGGTQKSKKPFWSILTGSSSKQKSKSGKSGK